MGWKKKERSGRHEFSGRWEMVDGGWVGILWIQDWVWEWKVSGGKGGIYGFLESYCGDNLHGKWWPCLLIIAEEMIRAVMSIVLW